jgi:glycogen phosphorylase
MPTKLDVPAVIAGLESLAYNLRWTWRREASSLFRWLDPDVWIRSHHNPVRLLADLPPARLAEAAADPDFVGQVAAETASLDAYLAARAHREPRKVAYFSAEFAIADCLRVFSGGLGVLAGDHLKSASDLGIPLVGLGLLYREGYFTQSVDAHGWQRETYRHLEPLTSPLSEELLADGSPLMVGVGFPGRTVFARVWRAGVGAIPLYLLDTDVDVNSPDDRHITDRLYGGDLEHRLKQELVLGIGGVRALAALGHDVDVLHLNEGHAAFAVFERLRHALDQTHDFDAALAAVAQQTVFTTHTPVEAGHDYFPHELIERYFRRTVESLGIPWSRFWALGDAAEPPRAGTFCMTALALRGARTANGVSRLHGRVSRSMWRNLFDGVPADDVPIGHVTNGVHLASWVGAEMTELYRDAIDPEWRERTGSADWSRAVDLPADRLWAAKGEQRHHLIDRLHGALVLQARARGVAGDVVSLDPNALTITFARRFATYKRATLLLSDPQRLARIIGDPERPVQIVFAGKAHPRDEGGKQFLHDVFSATRMPQFRGRIVFVENYDVELARALVQGSDVWLNVPRRPLEASGTSGMKAAANGGLNLSITDGWWLEAWQEHNALDAPIGWAIEAAPIEGPAQDAADADTLYRLLESEIVPLFHARDENGIPQAWIDRMRSAIAQVCAFFNTDRMVSEYVDESYRLRTPARVT